MKSIFKLKQIAAFVLTAGLLTGCKSGVPSVSEVKEYKAYSREEAMILVATEKNRYEEVYTDQIWKVTFGEHDVTFEQFLLGQVKTFLEDMKTMNLLAEEKGVKLTSAEQDQVRQLAEAYYKGLTPEDIDYMKITEEHVLHMYEEYCLANKLVNELTKDVDLEVSDNEAKMIDIEQIRLSDETAAQTVYEKVTAEGADFMAIAKANSLDTEISRQLGKGDSQQSFEDAAFALTEGQISSVLSSDGSYYIIRCVSSYNAAATQEHKKKLSSDRKNQAFRQIYDQFHGSNQITFSDEIWGNITFSGNDKTTTTNFFELYKEYFPE